jgi:hypothetical protein
MGSLRCWCWLYLPRTASFNPPTAFCTLPAALSVLPSVSSFLSPKTFPAASFTEPLACSAEPLIRSLSIAVSSQFAGSKVTASSMYCSRSRGYDWSASFSKNLRAAKNAAKNIDAATDEVVKIEQTLSRLDRQNRRVLIRHHADIQTGSGCPPRSPQLPGNRAHFNHIGEKLKVIMKRARSPLSAATHPSAYS